MADGTALIYFRCAVPSHQNGVAGRTADTLTIHEGKWSYCPFDIGVGGHDWQDTGGMRIEMLRRGSPTINLDLDVRPHLATPAPVAATVKAPTVTRKRPAKR